MIALLMQNGIINVDQLNKEFESISMEFACSLLLGRVNDFPRDTIKVQIFIVLLAWSFV